MLRTKSGLPKHCCWNTDQHGKRRVRFRRREFSTYLTGTPWGEEFMRQYAAALDADVTGVIGAEKTKPGTFNALVVSYYRSPEFLGLRESTKADRFFMIESFRKLHGDKPVRKLQRVHINEIIAQKRETPAAANNLLKVLRLLLNYAITIDMITSNPAIGVKRLPTSGEGYHTWTEDEIQKFENFHPVGSRARLALCLLLYTAQRRSDVIRMGWQHVKDDTITVKQQKTGAALWIPIHPELKKVLASVARTNLTFLLTARGAPFTPHTFGNWFKLQCRAAGLPHCSAHGLRKSAATRLANAGCSSDQIMAITGHKTLAEVSHYTRAADQKRLARQALRIQIGSEEEQKLSNLPSTIVQPGDK
jgi:integrase